MMKKDEQRILELFAEAGTLKRVKRSGWWMTGSPGEESVAEHSFRCAVIGYVLARMEDADPFKVLMMCLFNDIHESRIGDPHKVAHRYLDVRKAEKEAFREQVEGLPYGIDREFSLIREEYEEQSSRESIVARDADILECLFQAREFMDMGFRKTEKFFIKAPDNLLSESARRLWGLCKEWNTSEWWEKLSGFER